MADRQRVRSPRTEDRPARASFVPALGHDQANLRSLASTVGNQALGTLLSPVDGVARAEMSRDVEIVVARLREQVLTADEKQELVNLVCAWADRDTAHRAAGGGTPFLDRFLTMLRLRVFSRGTARTAFGLGGNEWLSAYDGLEYELGGPRLDRFHALVALSHADAMAGPAEPQGQSVYGFVGRRLGLGAVGIIKQLGLALTSLSDALAWAEWRRSGRMDDPPQLSPDVTKGFDELAALLADTTKKGGNTWEEERDRQELLAEYAFGDRWGKVPAALMLAGLGGAGGATKAVAGAAQLAQGAQAVETSAKKIYDRVMALRHARPGITTGELLGDPEIRLEIVSGLVSLVGLVGGLAGDRGVLGQFFQRFGIAVDAASLAPVVMRAWQHYTDPKLAGDPAARRAALEADLAEIVGAIATAAATRAHRPDAAPPAPAHHPTPDRSPAPGGPAPTVDTAPVPGPQRPPAAPSETAPLLVLPPVPADPAVPPAAPQATAHEAGGQHLPAQERPPTHGEAESTGPTDVVEKIVAGIQEETHDQPGEYVTDGPGKSFEAKATRGEATMAFAYGAGGWSLLEGPSGARGHPWNAHGFDAVAFRSTPDGTLEIRILDNKAYKSSKNIGEATAITDNLEGHLADLFQRLADPGFDSVPRIDEIRLAIDAAAANPSQLPGNVTLVITTFGGNSAGITKKLTGRQVNFKGTDVK